jgi:mutator protein MutT
VLTLRRSAECSNNAGRWDLPGGKVEPGETVEQAIVREVAEETGLVIQPEKFLTALEWPTPHARIIYLYFYAHAKTTAVRMGPEHDRHEWLTFEEQTELKLAPHFKNLVEQMQAKQAANLVLERYLEQVENEQDGD